MRHAEGAVSGDTAEDASTPWRSAGTRRPEHGIWTSPLDVLKDGVAGSDGYHAADENIGVFERCHEK